MAQELEKSFKVNPPVDLDDEIKFTHKAAGKILWVLLHTALVIFSEVMILCMSPFIFCMI